MAMLLRRNFSILLHNGFLLNAGTISQSVKFPVRDIKVKKKKKNNNNNRVQRIYLILFYFTRNHPSLEQYIKLQIDHFD